MHDRTRHRHGRLARDRRRARTREPSRAVPFGEPGHPRDLPAPAARRRPAGAGCGGRGGAGGRCARGLTPRGSRAPPASLRSWRHVVGPEPRVDGGIVVVRAGDTLWSIAVAGRARRRPAAARRPARPRHATVLALGSPVSAIRRRRTDARGRPSGTAGTVAACAVPFCEADDDKVVDSRPLDDCAAVRRRRECLACGRRFTTYERVDELPLMVVKRSGRQGAVRASRSCAAGSSGRSPAARSPPTAVEALVAEIEEEARAAGPEVTSELARAGGARAAAGARPVSYLRFASVYKGFDDARRLRARGRSSSRRRRHPSGARPAEGAVRRVPVWRLAEVGS